MAFGGNPRSSTHRTWAQLPCLYQLRVSVVQIWLKLSKSVVIILLQFKKNPERNLKKKSSKTKALLQSWVAGSKVQAEPERTPQRIRQQMKRDDLQQCFFFAKMGKIQGFFVMNHRHILITKKGGLYSCQNVKFRSYSKRNDDESGLHKTTTKWGQNFTRRALNGSMTTGHRGRILVRSWHQLNMIDVNTR